MSYVTTKLETDRSTAPRLPWTVGAVIVGTDASPYLAVGDVVVNHTPAWLKEFAVSNFGTNDKLVLLSTMGVVLVVLGALARILSRRTPAPGTVFDVVLGVAAVAG